MSDAPYTIGIEEEYLLCDAETLELTDAPEPMIDACREALGDQVAPEFLRCQIEVGTKVCKDVTEAQAELNRLRATVSQIAGAYGLTPIASACHPTADWTEQTHRDRPRYNDLRRDLAAVAQRMLICGMHVHVGLPAEDTRIDVMNQLTYFLPHLLALSTSSPFWQGRDTGMASYRIGIFDNLPRTGLPPRMASWSEWRRSVETLTGAGLIEDATKIWWDLRPSDKFPTLETRICDACPRASHALAIAALVQALTRFFGRLKAANQRWRDYDNFLINENRWRAQRYGCAEGMLDLGLGGVIPMSRAVDETIALVAEDAEVLGSEEAIAGLRDIVSDGTSAMQQRIAFEAARAAGADMKEAMQVVLRELATDFARPA